MRVFEKQVRVKVPVEALRNLKEVCGPSESPEKLILDLLEKYAELVAERNELRSAREKGGKLLRSLRQDLEAANLELEELGKANKSYIEQVAALKVEYHLMESRVRYLEENPPVQETVVYRENTEAISALKKKKDELQHSVWEKESALQKVMSETAELKASLSKLRQGSEERTRKRFALLLTRKGPGPAPAEWDIEARTIDSSEYYSWKADEADFRKRKNIRGSLMIIPIEEIRE